MTEVQKKNNRKSNDIDQKLDRLTNGEKKKRIHRSMVMVIQFFVYNSHGSR